MSRSYSRYLPALMLVLILAAAAYAFAAANTVPETGAGDGNGAISGYAVNNIHYNLNAANPATLDSVQFTLAAIAGAGTPTSVRVQLNGGGSWYTCTVAAGTWTCPVAGTTVLSANNLRVVAAE
jgi:hypothetical protein